jgi:hypothetical protein
VRQSSARRLVCAYRRGPTEPQAEAHITGE